MVIDYEGAWHDLGELIASKSQHGREPTLIAMQEIAARHRVPAGELSRLLRLYGVEVERARRITDPDKDADLEGGEPSPADDALPDHHDPRGGHDGRQHSHTPAAVG